MLNLSEKTQTAISRYFRRLVKKQPRWLKLLFDSEQIAFVIDPHGVLGLEVDEALPEDIKVHARGMIARYMQKHPVRFLERREGYDC